VRWLLLDQVEHRLSESPHQPLGGDRPDAPNHSRGEIPLDPLHRRWRGDLEEIRTELLSVGAIIHPGSANLDELAGGDHCCMPDHRHQVALPPGALTRNTQNPFSGLWNVTRSARPAAASATID
jgi:hypothetical protein